MYSENLKQAVTVFNLCQKAEFHQTDVHTLLHQRSQFYDGLLISLWQEVGLAQYQDIALLAVGGYGRQEMFPLSDLDILIVSEMPLTEEIRHLINQFFNLLWDSKLQVGSAVRTLDECIAQGKAEISIATNMLESRFIMGEKSLWQQLMSRLFQPDFWSIPDFFYAKTAEQETRYARYHHTGYNLEPDLKHSPGGLRDLHLLSWIMLRQYGSSRFDTGLQKGLLYPEEKAELVAAQTLLFKMRFGLHLQLKRYDNRLRFDRQLQLSEQLGYTGGGNHAVEAMMKKFFQATQTVSQLTRLILRHFEQTVVKPPLQKNSPKQPLDACFSLHDNLIAINHPHLFNQKPDAILDLFYWLTVYPQAEVETTTLRRLRLALQQLNQSLSEDHTARLKFLRLFSQSNVISRAIEPMHQFGVLAAYLPQWTDIQGLMQFDLFHLYTVDEHTIRVMRNLEQFLNEQHRQRFPLCCRLFPTLPNRPLLYLAALFHDIGKGKKGDHADIGAEEIINFAEQHQFNSDEIELMRWLVKEHLTMSVTAQRRDIHDPQVIEQFADIVGSADALSALTCLTVADIDATNDTLWNDWKQTLFTQLYQLTLDKLESGENHSTHKQASEHKRQIAEQLKLVLSGTEQQKLEQFWQHCPPDYFARHTPTQLVWHATHYLKQTQRPIVLVSNRYSRAATEIFIHCDDRPHLFAKIAHTLSRKKISIHDAQIMTGKEGMVLDSFIVTEYNGQALNTERISQIRQALYTALSQQNERSGQFTQSLVKHRQFKRKTIVRFLNDGRTNATAFELITLDREGLLAHLSEIFNQLSLNLMNAKITTIGEQVEDFFVVSTQFGEALSDEMKTLLQAKIMSELSV